MEYRIIIPQHKKWLRLFPIALFSFIYVYFLIRLIFLPYQLKKPFDYRLMTYLIAFFTIIFLIFIFINYFYSKIGGYIFKRIKATVSIYQNYIESKIFFITARFYFDSIKKIKILDKDNPPIGIKLLFETNDLKGIKIETKGFWGRANRVIFNIENFDQFIEELKAKLPYSLAQNITR